ncbi:hypothetical protein TrVE_jg6659 [Triparma verrucosa]|uniref:Uncharacterized protein n=1 Tax=Triparma verrucosa TaxID=1606542 RepID=A0A9W7B1X1_9STRA|nr:hypothetical protein TrVE_jg6659 [Triparma verrucosa]
MDGVSNDQDETIPLEITSTVRDLKSLVLSLQETEKDKEGYPEKAEGMLATAIAEATSAFLRALVVRLTNVENVRNEEGRLTFDDAFVPKVTDFQEFVQSGYLLIGVDGGASFEMLGLAEVLYDKIDRKEFGENLYSEVFSFLTHLCDSVADLEKKSQFFKEKAELLVKKLKKLENFVSSLPSTSTLHLYPALVRFLFKHGAKLASDESHASSIEVLKILLTITNKLLPATSEEASNLDPKVRPTTFELMAVNCEALYILSHIYVSSEKRYDDAVKCLDHIEESIKMQRHCIAECIAGKENDEEQVASSKLALDIEAAKVLFSRSMIAHCTCDDVKALEFVSELVKMQAVKKSDEVFELTLYACRAQAIAAISSNSSVADPFALLLSTLSVEKDAEKIKEVKIDKAHSIISGVDEMLRNRCTNSSWLNDAKALEDKEGGGNHDKSTSLVNDAFAILFELEPLCAEDKGLKAKVKGVISKGAAVLSMHKLHDYVVKWCQLALNLYTSDEEKKGKEYAGILSAFAAATSLTGSESANILLAVEKSSEAFDIWPLSARYFATWLECALRAEFGGLVELSNIIEEIDAKIAVSVKKGMKARELMAAFSMFSYICADLTSVDSAPKSSEHAVLLLTVLARWIETLGDATSHFNDCTGSRSPPNSPSPSKKRRTPPSTNDCPQSLFELVRVFLSQLEKLVVSQEEASKGAATLRSLSGEVDGVLKTCLDLLLKVRDRTKTPKKLLPSEEPATTLSRASSNANSANSVDTVEVDTELTADECFDDVNGVLIWEDAATEAKIGKQEECIWIAEELWNLGIKCMQLDEHESAAGFFANGHDFILLAYEEEGNALTKRCLDFEGGEEPISANVRCSDFSVQSLVLSVTAHMDSVDASDDDEDPVDVSGVVEASKRKDKAARAFWRISTAKAESGSCSDSFNQANGVFLEFLVLRCAIELEDDQLVMKTVDNSGFGAKGSLGDTNLNLLLLCAQRAHLKGLRMSATRLYGLASGMMLEGERKDGKYGRVQRKLLQLAGDVGEVTDFFKRVEEAVASNKTDVENLFGQDDLNYFCVEAYNRGIALSSFGDVKGSESLLRAALNLLPFSDSEIKSFGEQIREAYVKAAAALESNRAGFSATAAADFNNGFVGARFHALFLGVSPQK